MAMRARCEPPPHFEVVDEADQTVGNAKFATSEQAHELRRALKNTPKLGKLAVARVYEKVVVERRVVLLCARRRVADTPA